jgi:DNA-binding NtrC family response regulator
MNGQILCIGGDATRWQSWGHDLEESGYVVIHAADEGEASTLLRACPVDVVCIDSKLMAESGGTGIAAHLKGASPHVPVVLIQTSGSMPEHFEEHVDVVIDESTFSTVGPWLIDELRDTRFPMFMEWLEAWRERSEDTGNDAVRVH